METRTGAVERAGAPPPLSAGRDVAEFFAGIGLMRMGLERHGWTVAFANDIAVEKYRMYAAQYADAAAHFHLADIHRLDPATVPTVTLATASFPCTDLSLAGGRRGLDGAQSSAYWGFVRVLEAMGRRRPALVLLENVAGFLSSNGGRDFGAALTALNRLGYAVDPLIIDAARFVPQSRVRLFVVAHRDVAGIAPQACRNEVVGVSDVRPRALVDFIQAHSEIDWYLPELPPLPRSATALADILDVLPEDSLAWWKPERRDYLISQMSPRHAETLRRMTAAGRLSWGTVFRRVRNGRCMAELRTDGVAGCLRTPRGGSGRQILVEAGRGQVRVRLLTPQECARLMGADGFAVDVTLNRALFGLGDAVCVPVVAWIAEHCLNPLTAAGSR